MARCFGKGFRNIFLYGILLLVLGCSSQSRNPFTAENFGKFSNGVINDLPCQVVSDANIVFINRANMAALLLAGGASAAMHNSNIDDHIAENFERHHTFEGFSDDFLSIMGGPGPHFALTAIWYMTSTGCEDQLNQERAWIMLRALSLTGLTTVGLKVATNTKAPNGSGLSWPSGHTASSFTAASVLDEFYGPKVGIPAYGFASVVAWRMMDAKEHCASDILFGATLGWIVGHTVAGHLKPPEVAGFQIMPATVCGDTPMIGVNLIKLF